MRAMQLHAFFQCDNGQNRVCCLNAQICIVHILDYGRRPHLIVGHGGVVTEEQGGPDHHQSGGTRADNEE